jgi:serine/threonine protein kinase
LPASSKTLAMDLLKKMLTFNPQRRITIVEAMDHPFFYPLKQRSYFTAYIAKAKEAYIQCFGNVQMDAIDDSADNLFKNVRFFFLLFCY